MFAFDLFAFKLGSNSSRPPECCFSFRMEMDGPNVLQTVQRTPWSRILIRQFKSLLIWVLVAAAILSAVLGEWWA
jgi:magnesium-transporting ATPase (P-type)